MSLRVSARAECVVVPPAETHSSPGTFTSVVFNPLALVGIQTGRCIPYDQKRKTCEIFAWCPAEEGKEAPR